jgi:hypothetical protein
MYWAIPFSSIVLTMIAYKNEEEFLNELRDALLEVNGGEIIPQEVLEECGK